MLANHSGKNTSLIAPALFSFSTSSFTASTWGFVALLGLCFVGGVKGSTFNQCMIKAESTPSTSYRLHVNTSKFCTNDNRISNWSPIDKLLSIWKYLLEYNNILTWTNSSTLSTTAKLTTISNCYNCSRSICSFCYQALSRYFLIGTNYHNSIFNGELNLLV